jgi:hypothetical protein
MGIMRQQRHAAEQLGIHLSRLTARPNRRKQEQREKIMPETVRTTIRSTAYKRCKD